MCTGHDSSSVHPKERQRGNKDGEEKTERWGGGRQERKQCSGKKTEEDENNDGRIEKERNREITELLRHTSRKHVTTFSIKHHRWDEGDLGA